MSCHREKSAWRHRGIEEGVGLISGHVVPISDVSIVNRTLYIVQQIPWRLKEDISLFELYIRA